MQYIVQSEKDFRTYDLSIAYILLVKIHFLKQNLDTLENSIFVHAEFMPANIGYAIYLTSEKFDFFLIRVLFHVI